MAGLIFPSVGIFGSSGSGKSTFAKGLIAGMLPKSEHMVIVNETRELSDLAAHHEVISHERALGSWDVDKLEAFIRHYKRVHFEVGTTSPVPFMHALSQAVYNLGEFEAPNVKCLFVTDECHNFLSKKVYTTSDKVQKIDQQGRKFGIVGIKITPRISSVSQDSIAHSALTQCRQVFLFPMNAGVDIEAAKREGFPDPSKLVYPDTDRNLPGEYYAADKTRGTVYHVRRDDQGKRYAEQIAGIPQNFSSFVSAQA
jgi:DNA helicase HerA-like ATPase